MDDASIENARQWERQTLRVIADSDDEWRAFTDAHDAAYDAALPRERPALVRAQLKRLQEWAVKRANALKALDDEYGII